MIKSLDDALWFLQENAEHRSRHRQHFLEVDPGEEWIFWQVIESDVWGRMAAHRQITLFTAHIISKPSGYRDVPRRETYWQSATLPSGLEYQWAKFEVTPDQFID